MSYLVNPYMVTPSGASVTWEDPFTSDNWTSASGSNYIDTTNNRLIRDANDSIYIQLPFSPDISSVDGAFVITYGYQRTANGWASQSYFGMATQAGFAYNSLDDNNEWMALMSNDWESAGGMRTSLRAKYGGSEEETNSSSNATLSVMDDIVYCKSVFDASASDILKTSFFSDEAMETPLTIGSLNYRSCGYPSNWDSTESTWYLFCSGYYTGGYSSTQNIYPIKFYNGVTEI